MTVLAIKILKSLPKIELSNNQTSASKLRVRDNQQISESEINHTKEKERPQQFSLKVLMLTLHFKTSVALDHHSTSLNKAQSRVTSK